MTQLSIIIPVYNEVDNLNPLVKRIASSLKSTLFRKSYEIVFVDDSSTDGTTALINKLKSAYPIRLYVRKEKGLSSALVFGLKKAKGDAMVVMDADLSHPPELIPSMIRLSKSNGLVIASRFVKGGGVRSWTFDRKMISFIARLLARPLTKVRDPVSGFFLVRKKDIEGIILEPRSWKILLEIICKSKSKRMAELPYVFFNREKGASKLDSKEFLNYFRHIIALWLGK